MTTLELADICCCQGAATSGYMRVGWTVDGVDTEDRHRKYYPGRHFYVTDGLDFLRRFWRHYDAIHVSPPCQYYSRGNAVAIKAARAANNGEPPAGVNGWPRLIPQFRELLEATGLPYVMENVVAAGWDMVDPVKLCGCMFDLKADDIDGMPLRMERPRLFETNWGLTAPRPCDHTGREWVAGAYGGARRARRRAGETLAQVAPRDRYAAKYIRKGGYVPRSKAVVAQLLGVDHNMTLEGLKECVPPAYTAHIGAQLAAHLTMEGAA